MTITSSPCLHAPELGSGGHVHYVELDQFHRAELPGHGARPAQPGRESCGCLRRYRARCCDRIEQDEIHPRTPMELSYSIVSAMARRETDLVAALAKESGRLEQQVTDADHDDDPGAAAGGAVRRSGTSCWRSAPWPRTARATYGGMAKRVRSIPDQEKPLVGDTCRPLRDGPQHGRRATAIPARRDRVLSDPHQHPPDRRSRESSPATSVRQNDDMRRITAWVAIIAVPTAVTGFFGQNVPYPGFGQDVRIHRVRCDHGRASRSFCSSSSRPRNGSDCTVRTRRASFRKASPQAP